MATIARGSKAAGGTSFVDGTTASAGEVNTDFDTIYNEFNGSIDNDNIDASAAIELSKLDGYSDSASERRTETSPGVTGTESDAANLQEELARIRYKLHELGLGISTIRNTTASGDDTYWIDTPQMGPNLIRNGNFAVGLESNVPPGWTNVNTATLALTTTGVTEGHSTARALRITAAGGTDEGVSQTLVGLKASTKYVVGCRAKATAGDTFKLTTTGASGATFGNLTLTTTSTSYVTLAGVIVTDGTPTDIVVSLLAAADTDVVDVTHVWVRECATDRLPMSNTSWAYNEATGTGAIGTTFTDTGLTVSVVAPGPGYNLEVKVHVHGSNDSAEALAVQLRENGTAVAVGYVLVGGTGLADVGTAMYEYIKRDPTPGTTYTYTVFAAFEAAAGTLNLGEGAAIDGETAVSWLMARAVLESGGH